MGPNSAWDLQFTALGFRLRFRLQDLGLNALGLYVLRDLGFVVLLSLFWGRDLVRGVQAADIQSN